MVRNSIAELDKPIKCKCNFWKFPLGSGRTIQFNSILGNVFDCFTIEKKLGWFQLGWTRSSIVPQRND